MRYVEDRMGERIAHRLPARRRKALAITAQPIALGGEFLFWAVLTCVNLVQLLRGMF